MKVKLDVATRVGGGLASLVSDQTGNHEKMNAIRKFKESLLLSREEVKLIGFVEELDGNGRMKMKWEHPENDPMKEIDINSTILSAIRERLGLLEKNGKLTEAQDILYEKFVEALKETEIKEKK